MQRHGWTLLFHDCILIQLEKLRAAAVRAEKANPKASQYNANVKLFKVLSHLILEIVPSDPARDEYRLGNTMGTAYRHWRRIKIAGRFRLFFRYDSRSKTIVFAWVNDEQSLRSAGSKSDPYAVFEKMLVRGNPPDEWAALVAASGPGWPESGD